MIRILESRLAFKTPERSIYANSFRLPPVACRAQISQLTEGKAGLVKTVWSLRDKVEALVTLGLGFEPCHETDLLGKALEMQERHGLLTNDSLIAAIALRIGADVLVSADTRFQAIKELRTYAPSDLKVPS